MPSQRLYLDNTATSFPKPIAVIEAMTRYSTEMGASPGRGGYEESREAARLMNQCRERINTLINGESAQHIVFTLNATDALNLAIKGILRYRLRSDAAPHQKVLLHQAKLDPRYVCPCPDE